MQKLFLLLTLLGLSCGKMGAQSGLLHANAFEKMLQTDKTVQLVDVRTPAEFKSGHIQGAVNFDFYAADFAQKLAKLDKKRPVMVYCAVGGRSGSAAGQLKKLGFTKVFDLDGGIGAWRDAGKKETK
ncbi:MAG: rhodanese-like domain-containing protein [Haliscomenobacteraceae bacterium CHB4]|nr:Thiosulfate sulfurtransferase GlpE [Saprospiraceae bacterium]MCE7921865.1 rhodanese-like domain-containing protein [Haliscomenobacteraceae bacterium CHB4]